MLSKVYDFCSLSIERQVIQHRYALDFHTRTVFLHRSSNIGISACTNQEYNPMLASRIQGTIESNRDLLPFPTLRHGLEKVARMLRSSRVSLERWKSESPFNTRGYYKRFVSSWATKIFTRQIHNNFFRIVGPILALRIIADLAYLRKTKTTQIAIRATLLKGERREKKISCEPVFVSTEVNCLPLSNDNY